MKSLILFSFILLINTVTLFSANLRDTSRFDVNEKVFARQDTLEALNSLKNRLNKNSKVHMRVGAIGIGVTLLLVAIDPGDASSPLFPLLGGGSAGIFAAGWNRVRRTNKYFRNMTAEYQNGKALPKKVVDQLLPEDFVK